MEGGQSGEGRRAERTRSAICLFLSNSALNQEIVSFRVAGCGMTGEREIEIKENKRGKDRDL
jgi:hypothetical protein